jgi:multidrug efflux pump subunit AcrA (membrane-fusion protein)
MKKLWDRFDPEGKHLILCFLTVLALTLFARGFAGSAQAEVTVASPRSRVMSGKFQTIGNLTPLAQTEYPIPEGLVIEKTAQVGTALEVGDVVTLVDAEALDDLITRTTAEAVRLELRIEGLLEDNSPSKDGVNAANEAVSDAKTLRSECRAMFAAAEEALAQAPEEEKEAAEAAAMEAQQRLIDAEEALADARETLKREEAAYADAQTRARREMGSNEAEASILQLDLGAISDRLQKLETVREDGYAVTATADGRLAGLTDSSFAMTNPYGGNLLTFSLDEEDAAFLTARTKLVLSREEQKAEVTGCTQNEDGAFSVPVVRAGWEPGTVTVSGILWEESYDVCVPVEALRRDSGGHFLFVLERKTTLWSIEQTVRKVYVYPERMDGAFAAVTGLEPGHQVIVTSSKPLTEGSRIRVTP